MKSLFITGTDTNIGKTFVSAVLTLGLKAHYWKPIQSGIGTETDTEFLKRVTNLPDSFFLDEVYKLKIPRSPHESAKAEGITIDINSIKVPELNNCIVIEGAGGVLVPLNDTHFVIDLIKKLKSAVILVCRTQLGTINHTLLTIEALQKRGIPVLGIIMNGEEDLENPKSISMFTKIPILGQIKPYKSINKETLIHAFSQLDITPILTYLEDKK